MINLPAIPLLGAVFTVRNTSDSGPVSLRQAILDANAAAGEDLIRFEIPGAAPYTINLTSGFPDITDIVMIDGTTQAGYAGKPIIEINGANAGVDVSGLLIRTNNCVVRGLVINRFRGNGAGIYILGTNATGNKVEGNFIGTDLTGTAALANARNGVLIYSASGNIVGGGSLPARNVISGNGQSGVYLFGSDSRGNLIQGNLIGTDVTGTLDLGNAAEGVTIHGAVSNVIGGATSDARNIISGNNSRGISLEANAAGNLVQGNYVGTDVSGHSRLGNAFSGIEISTSSYNTVGGTVPGARNLISGNGTSGIFITNAASTNNVMQGNFIGTDETGTNPLGNGFDGIGIENADGNKIGGTIPGAGNLISGNTQFGISINDSSASANQVMGNLVGTDASGRVAIANLNGGIGIIDAPSNLIGGTSAGAGNLISGNLKNGVYITGATATNNQVQGNLVGTGITGKTALGNENAGVEIYNAHGNRIGGASLEARNVLSANLDSGVQILALEGSATANWIQGNFLGTDITGSVSLPNRYNGVYIEGASGNAIGGASIGSGNLISGNSDTGLLILHSTATNNIVLGNLIGTQADGTGPLGNGAHGVAIDDGARNNVIGGISLSEGNTIAFNATPLYSGVRIYSGTGNLVRGNSIFSNGGLAIDLEDNGVAPNDTRDGDSGANNLQNFPVLSSASSAQDTTIVGTLNSVPNRDFTLDFYQNELCDPSGSGEGQSWLASTTVHTDDNGEVIFTAILSNVCITLPTVTATATDAGNNTSEFSTCVVATITDTQPPTISCAGPITMNLAPAMCTANVTFTVTATDNCQVTNLTSVPASGFEFPVGVTTVTSTALDSSGNSSVCTFTVTVHDTQPPQLACPANFTVDAVPDTLTSNVTFRVSASDNCVVTNLVSVPPSGFAFPAGTTTVTNTATDASGNSSVCTFTVTVVSVVAPLLRMARFENEFVIAWPSSAEGYMLEATEILLPADWQIIPSVLSGNEFVATNSFTGSGRFYRLRK